MLMQSWKCALALCVFGFVMGSQAEPQGGIAGEWDGVIAGKLRIIFRIEKNADQSLHGLLESPDQGGAKVAMDEISFDGKRAVRFEWKNLGAMYEGELRADGTELTGTWQQGGARLPLVLRRPGSEPTAAAMAKLKPVTRGSIQLQPCLSGGSTQALCGTFDVYENRVSRSGRKIALNLLILPALTDQPVADPVFGFAGGPGQSAVEAFPHASYLTSLQQRRDIVLIDQRGTGKSNPLPCPVDPTDLQTLIGHSISVEKVAGCRAELEKIADLTQYTTSN